MDRTRRAALITFLATSAVAAAQDGSMIPDVPKPGEQPKEPRLPDGRSQTNAIAKQEHEASLKDARQLVDLAQQIRDEVEKAGSYVVPVSTIRKTEEIERLAKKIRSRLKS